jgi:carbon storage regulator
MLVLTRKLNQSILIDGDIRVMVVELHGNQVRLGIDAPKSVRILREELRRPAASGVARAGRASTGVSSGKAAG